MKILITESQLQRVSEQETTEAVRYDFNDPTKQKKSKKRMDYRLIMANPNENVFYKKVGDFSYFYNDSSEEGEIIIKVVDDINKSSAAHGAFFMVDADNFEATSPFVYPEYRRQGIAIQMYKMALDFGNLLSGEAQSQYAESLWKKLYDVFPNHMVVYNSQTKKEYEITKDEKGDFIIPTEPEMDIYGPKTYIQLKLYKN